MRSLKTISFSGFLYFYYSVIAMVRQAQYGIQILFLPALGLSIFLAVFAATKMVHGNTQTLFFPFLVYNFINFPLGAVMQGSFHMFTNPSRSNVYLATPTSLNALLGIFLGDSWTMLIGNLMGVLVAAMIVRPVIFPLPAILSMALLLLFLVPSVWLGMAMGMRLLFAHQLSQFVFLGLFVIIALPTNLPWLWVIAPFTAVLYLFNQSQIVWQPFWLGLAGTIFWWILSKFFLSLAYKQYRLGLGVDRR